MIYFANVAIDVGNAIMSALPFLCYAVGIACFVTWIFYLYQKSSPATYTRGDGAKGWIAVVACAFFLTFPSWVAGFCQTFGLPVVMGTGEDLTPFVTQTPNLLGATPVDFAMAMIGVFAPFFHAVGAVFIFKALLTFRDSHKHGVSAGGPILCFIIAGVVFLRLEVLVPKLVTAWGGAA